MTAGRPGFFGVLKKLFLPSAAPEPPVASYETLKRAAQNDFRDRLAEALVNGCGDKMPGLDKLFKDPAHADQRFQMMSPRALRACDSKNGITIDCPLKETRVPADADDLHTIAELKAAHVPCATGRQVARTFAPAPSRVIPVSITDPDTKVLEVYNGKTGKIDSILFVTRKGIVISVGQQDGRLTSALTQARELRPAQDIHHLYPQNTAPAVAECVHQMRLRYASHLKEIARVDGASPRDHGRARTDIVIPGAARQPALPSGKNTASFGAIAGSVPKGPTDLPPMVKTGRLQTLPGVTQALGG